MLIVHGLARLALAAVLFAVFASPSFGQTASKKQLNKAAREHERGMRALRDGKLEKALKRFEKSIDAVASFPPAHTGRGHVLFQQQDYQAALAEYELARDGYREIGAVLYHQKSSEYQDAQQEMRRLERDKSQIENGRPKDEQDAQARRRTVVQYEAKISQLRSLPLPTPETSTEAPGEVHFLIGNSLFQLKRYDEAIASWEESVRRDPSLAAAHSNLAFIYWRGQQRLDDARLSLQRAEELGFDVDPELRAELDRAAVASAQQHGGVVILADETVTDSGEAGAADAAEPR